MSIETEAWVLYQRNIINNPGELIKESFMIPPLKENEVLIEPIFGCWEANMDHALKGQPIDICQFRQEEKVVIGNAGVARIIKINAANTQLSKGMICLVLASTQDTNKLGHPKPAYAYDAPDTIGLLAKQTKVHTCQLIPIPDHAPFTLEQWAAFALRYLTAWGNWQVAYPSFRVMVKQAELPDPHVWAWGGGVALAELELAKIAGCQSTMLTSSTSRLIQLKQLGLQGIERSRFKDLHFDPVKYEKDSDYKTTYLKAEKAFLKLVNTYTQGMGVSIFIDLIGEPVYRATLKAMGWPAVITTAGWKHGMQLVTNRALECMSWHTHIHTHYVKRLDVLDAIQFAIKHNWIPKYLSRTYDWDEIPQLAQDYQQGIDSYFPIYAVNRV